MSKRDWQRDMEICKQATPAPWKSVNEPEFDGNIEAPNLGLCIAQGVRAHDKAFIAEAREGWPAALERVLELEAVIKHCVDTECRKCYNYKTCDDKTNYGCGIYKLKKILNNEET